MTQQNQQQVSISNEQAAQAAAAGVEFFGLDTTLIPGNLRRQVAVLEVILQGLATGNLQVATPQQAPVESVPTDDLSDLTGTENDGDETETETG